MNKKNNLSLIYVRNACLKKVSVHSAWLGQICFGGAVVKSALVEMEILHCLGGACTTHDYADRSVLAALFLLEWKYGGACTTLDFAGRSVLEALWPNLVQLKWTRPCDIAVIKNWEIYTVRHSFFVTKPLMHAAHVDTNWLEVLVRSATASGRQR